ncbi:MULTISPECIES: hypothetical protein [Streptomyces]
MPWESHSDALANKEEGQRDSSKGYHWYEEDHRAAFWSSQPPEGILPVADTRPRQMCRGSQSAIPSANFPLMSRQMRSHRKSRWGKGAITVEIAFALVNAAVRV